MRFLTPALALLAAQGVAAEAPRPAGTREMAAALELVAQRVNDSGANPFAPGARIEYLRRLPPASSFEDRLRRQLELGRYLLEDGQTEEAIAAFEGIVSEARRRPDRIDRRTIDNLRVPLATAYLRLGEERNCVERHGAGSCLFPLGEGGVHRLQEPSRKAFDLLGEILADDPGDLTSAWLLNLAAMTLGRFPEAVPERWRLPPESLRSEAEVGRFHDRAPALGLDVVGLSGGCAVEDFDGDGHLDLIVSSWGLRDPLRYFRNEGDGSFMERTREAGLEGIVGGLNLVHADYDNDGRPDLLVLRGAWLGAYGRQPNSLLRNLGGGVFEDVTVAAGVADLMPTQTAAWGDYDNDGWLDLYVGSESLGDDRYPARLYHNDGDGTFTDQGVRLGLDRGGYVKGSAWGDVDNDGLPDLYVSRLLEPNLLFRNNGPDGEGGWKPFTEVAAEAGVEEPLNGFPTWFFDYDNDGWLDLWASSYDPDYRAANTGAVAAELFGRPIDAVRPRLYRNAGDGTFEDRTRALGLDRVIYAMGSNFGDLDNDGWPDLYLGTGTPDFRALIPNLLFRNDAARRFQDVTASAGVGHLQKGHGIAFADLDNDGDQDLVAVMGGAYAGDVYQNAVFENPGHGNRWITLLLEGVEANRSAIGARIRVEIETAEGRRDVHATVSTGSSFGSASLQQEIGLGRALRVRGVEIRWPGAASPQRLGPLALDRSWRVRQGETPTPLERRRPGEAGQ